MEQQESRTLTCPNCGEHTVTERVHRNRSQTGRDLGSKAATRTRKCISCGHTAESTERWAHDPIEVGNSRMGQILARIEGANDQIRRALIETKDAGTHQPGGDDAPETGHPAGDAP